MEMANTISASDFINNFSRYTLAAQREAVPVSRHGHVVGYFVAADEYEELRKLKALRGRVFKTADLSQEEAQAIFSSRMDPRHDHLNKLLDPK